jgi:protein dithiol:quinone oxidoreductase
MVSATSFANRTQPLAWLLAAICAGGLATGLFVQHVLGLEPCSLCVLQRLGFVLILLAAIPLAALPWRQLGATVLAGALVAAALFGFGTAAYQVWLQAFPPAMSSCGAGIGAYLEGWPFEQGLRWIFDSQGDCTRSSFDILGITLPQWGLLAFAFLSTAALRLFWLVQQR